MAMATAREKRGRGLAGGSGGSGGGGEAGSAGSEITRIGEGLGSLRAIVPALHALPPGAVVHSLNLHSNSIPFIDGHVLRLIPSLRRLDLSSNNISRIEALESLTELEELNLSCNEIPRIEGLEMLRNLRYLNLSFNRIKSLDGLQGLCQHTSSALSHLDLRGNLISDLDQLRHLRNFCHLRAVNLRSTGANTKGGNPICQSPLYEQKIRSELPSVSVDSILEYVSFDVEETLLSLDDKLGHNQTSWISSDPSTADRLPTSYLPRRDGGGGHKQELDLIKMLVEQIAASSKPPPPQPSAFWNVGAVQDSTHRLSELESKLAVLLERLSEDRNYSGPGTQTSGAAAPLTNKARRRRRRRRADTSDDSAASSSASDEDDSSSSAQFEIKSKTRKKQSEPESLTAHQEDADERRRREEETAAAARIIAELETEERAAREREQILKQQIKLLEEQRQHQEEVLQKLNTSNAELDRRIEAIQEEATQKDAKARAELEQAQQELANCKNELKSAVTRALAAEEELQRQGVSFDEDLERIEREMNRANSLLHQNEIKISQLEEEKSRLSVRILKEREAAKIKFAELKRENEIYQRNIAELRQDLTSVQANTASKEASLAQGIAERERATAAEIERTVTAATESLMKEHNRAIEAMNRTIQQIESEKRELESRLHQRSEVEAFALQNANNRIRQLEEDIRHISSLNEGHVAAQGELKSVIKDLTFVVRDQKRQLLSLKEQNDLAITIYEEKSKDLETRLHQLAQLGSQMEEIKQKEAQATKRVGELHNSLSKAQAEIQRMQAELSQSRATLITEKDAALAKLDDALREVAMLKREKEESATALRVKVKMLEDQNDTIKTLKHTIENKTRVQSAATTDWSKRLQKLEDSLESETDSNRMLTKELEEKERLIELLSGDLEDAREEASALKEQVDELSSKLRERNDCIAQIEEEVHKVKEVFAAREHRLILERDEAVQARTLISPEIQQLLETQEKRLMVAERERNSLAAAMQDLQARSAELERERAQHAAERKSFAQQLERQRAKFLRLKRAISTATSGEDDDGGGGAGSG
ncbi:hypothetical protein DFJ73DRAFT_849850 [Zopfochytrium polystomum]|nr:hypothetical protein DFJ73DRAFT_849850 [Zopfochytrium polystomum]